MKKPYTSFVTGLLVGVALFSGTTAYAAGIMAERSTNRIFVDGKEVQVEAYTIHNNNFMQLRDVGKAVGFNVYWDSDNGCVQVESGKPYTGTAPQQTAAAPTDGSRYVPKVGDVIRCDDGSDYTIKDVSRWDKNAFSSAPLGELPAATCDWSKLPQPEMPQAEARHFTSGGQDYLFQRNLYETRRMLYTLYNAIGDNPETWQNGQPVKFPSGNDKVKINLTIPAEVTPQSFWPWRAEQITELFNSCPPGTYSLEAWNVYKNGVFQYTEYSIHVS